MTESVWWTATDSLNVIDWLFFDTPASERKFRLFTAACCRRVESKIPFPEVINGLECIEPLADGSLPPSEASKIRRRLVRMHSSRHGIFDRTCEGDACRAVISALSVLREVQLPFHRSREWYESEDDRPYVYWTASSAAEAAGEATATSSVSEMRERLVQVYLLHDIFGPLPFHDVTISPSWLTTDVKLLVQGIYADKAFERMPILADALQEAGCDNEEILNHCRAENWEHFCGCWVIDLLLGRPWKEAG